jgi:hypothetical protein
LEFLNDENSGKKYEENEEVISEVKSWLLQRLAE